MAEPAVVETLEATVQRHSLSKYDLELEKSLRGWLSHLLEDPSISQTSGQTAFQELLKDGTLLCQLLLKLVCQSFSPHFFHFHFHFSFLISHFSSCYDCFESGT
ncbi:MAG: hypothetical protein Q8P67_27810 [archaeon]|nr:hypothetical protein [archaeon]